MLMQRILFHKKRGIATIIGAMVFIGILLTAVVPMFLVIQQADNYRERQLHKMDILDEEKEFELVEVYPIPSLTEDTINVTLINLSELPVEIVRLRINSTISNLTTAISTLSSEEIGPYPLIPVDGSNYDIRITTARGNVFASEIGVLFYAGGQWLSETLGFRLIFPSRPGKNQRENDWLNELMITIRDGDDIIYTNTTMYWAISASENFFELQSADYYNVTVYIKHKGTPQYWVKIYDAQHHLMWPEGPPIIELKFEISTDPDRLIIPGG